MLLIKYQNFNFYLDCGLSSLGNGGLSVESHNYRGGHAVMVSIVTTDSFFLCAQIHQCRHLLQTKHYLLAEPKLSEGPTMGTPGLSF